MSTNSADSAAEDAQAEAAAAACLEVTSSLIQSNTDSLSRTASENLNATRALETKVETLTSRLTSQIEGLQVGAQAILDTGLSHLQAARPSESQVLAEAPEARVLQAISEQNEALTHCYRACMAALKETTTATGHTYKYITAMDESRYLMGDLGNVPDGGKHTFENLTSKDKAWVVSGNMNAEAAADFFK